MPCYHPIAALQPTAGGPLLFAAPEHFYLHNDYRTLEIACGQCTGCRLTRSRHWAIRCLHEKQMHKYSCYLTLTFQGKQWHGASLNHDYFADFIKRLRSRITRLERRRARLIAKAKRANSHAELATVLAPLGPGENQNRLPSLLTSYDDQDKAKQIRYYMGGEYGEKYGRPHFHALLFGVDFQDRQLYRASLQGHNLYTSPTLTSLWKHGLATVGELTFESAAYVARYVMKKKTGDGNTKNYQIIDPETGEIHVRKKEYNTMSRRPGIGSSWMEKYAEDVYSNTGKVVIRGHQQNPPRYYDKLYKQIDQAHLEHLKYVRYLEAAAHSEHHTPERLAVQEQVTLARTKQLNRNFTNGD